MLNFISENRSAILHSLFFMKVIKNLFIWFWSIMRMLDPQTWQFDMSYCLLLPEHSPGIPISITSNTAITTSPPPFFLPLPKSQNVFSMHEYKHKLNQLCNKIWRDFYCTSHVYRMYKGTFEIKAGLNRNTSSK